VSERVVTASQRRRGCRAGALRGPPPPPAPPTASLSAGTPAAHAHIRPVRLVIDERDSFPPPHRRDALFSGAHSPARFHRGSAPFTRAGPGPCGFVVPHTPHQHTGTAGWGALRSLRTHSSDRSAEEAEGAVGLVGFGLKRPKSPNLTPSVSAAQSALSGPNNPRS
jgi:hypothetical protein